MSISTVIKTFAVTIALALVVYPTYQFISLRSQNYTTTVPPADVLVILGAAVWGGGQPSPVLRDRIARAVELYQQGVAKKIICTGGIGKFPPAEALAGRQALIQAGIPDGDIITETESTSTAEQAVRIKAICDQYGFHSIALVTSFFHERRATQLFRGAGFTTIEDARCTHERFQDLDHWVAREAGGLTLMNWWRWSGRGLGLGILVLGFQGLRRRRKGSRAV